jgi:hypothetical protein
MDRAGVNFKWPSFPPSIGSHGDLAALTRVWRLTAADGAFHSHQE